MLRAAFPNINILRPVTDANAAQIREEAKQLTQARKDHRNELVMQLANQVTNSSDENDQPKPFTQHFYQLFREELLLNGYNLGRTKLLRLFELAADLHDLEIAWQMWQINRVNGSLSHICISDSLIGYVLQGCLQSPEIQQQLLERRTASQDNSPLIELSDAKQISKTHVKLKINSTLQQIQNQLNISLLATPRCSPFNEPIRYLMSFIVDRERYGLTPSEFVLHWMLQRVTELDLGLGLYRALSDFGYLEFGTQQSHKSALQKLLEICWLDLPNDEQLYKLILGQCEDSGIGVPVAHWIRLAVVQWINHSDCLHESVHKLKQLAIDVNSFADESSNNNQDNWSLEAFQKLQNLLNDQV